MKLGVFVLAVFIDETWECVFGCIYLCHYVFFLAVYIDETLEYTYPDCHLNG